MGKPAILVVDDEPNIRGALQRWFQIRGFTVDTAEDGEEAVALCRTRRYDVITMDLEMPRMDGIAAMRAIRQLCPVVPILVVTGLPRDAQQALAEGAAKILMKPLRLSDLECEVRQVLGSGDRP